MTLFGGDDIDRLLEQADSRSKPSHHAAIPPPQEYYGSHRHEHKNKNIDKDDVDYKTNKEDRDNDKRGKDRHEDRSNAFRSARRYSRSRSRGRGRNGKGREGIDEHNTERGRSSRQDGGRRGRSRSPRIWEDDSRKDRERSEIERDQRTVFACQIHPKCDERDIFEFFSNVGKVIDVQLIRDNRTFKSKGLCYIEFEDKSSIPHALALSGQRLAGHPISVQLTQAEKNRAAQAAILAVNSTKPLKLYVTNIHPKVTVEDIRPVFDAFGEILSIEISKDHRNKSKGYGFVEFRKEIDAQAAMQQLNDLEILGQKIKVTPAEQVSNRLMNNNDLMIPSVSNNGILSDTRTLLEEESGNGGLPLTQSGKIALMQRFKLGGGIGNTAGNKDTNPLKPLPFTLHGQQPGFSGSINNNPSGVLPPTASVVMQSGRNLPPHLQNQMPLQSQSLTFSQQQQQQQQQQPHHQQQQPSSSRCVLLQHMFDPSSENDPDFDIEIREDVMEEVKKFGQLLHIYVDKTAKDGLVYLKFSSSTEAMVTIRNLDGRWFGKNQINAKYYSEQEYSQQFPDAP